MRSVVVEELTLKAGGHSNIDQGACLLEAASYLAGEPWSDHPACVSPVLGAYGRRLNDLLGDEDRQKLKPYIPLLLNTAHDGQDQIRRWMASDWAIRVATPRWLDAAGLTVHAATLRALPPIVDDTSAWAARDAARAARDEAWAARVRARAELTEKVKAELAKRGWQAAVAVAAAVADAAADADAAAVADAAAAAAAAADADAVAAADADAGFEKYSDNYYKVYDAVYDKMRAKYRSAIDDNSELSRVAQVNRAEAIELLGRMIDPSAVK